MPARICATFSGLWNERPGTIVDEVWDVTHRGARLRLAFDPVSNAFTGRVENRAALTLCAVRVEVHLSTGIELGPTGRTDLPAGRAMEVRLPAKGEAFEAWTAHPETSRCATK